MRKIWEGLKNGDWKTRLYIIGTTVLLLAGFGGIVISFQINSMWVFLAGVAAGIAAIAVAQKFTILTEEVEPPESEQTSKPEPVRMKPKPIKEKPEAERKPEPIKEKSEAEREPEPIREKPEAETEPKPVKKEPEPERESVSKQEVPLKSEEKKQQTNVLETYDEKALKQVFYKYKVKRDHKCIMIDSWKQYQLSECPAYIWLSRRRVHFLVLEANAREITVPEAELQTLKYRPGVICKGQEEYPQFRKASFVTGVFSKYLPSYHSGNKAGRPVTYKNLFELGHGLYLTNTSASVVLEMLQPVFQVEDAVTKDPGYQEVVKDIYKLGILLRNLVYTVKEYKALIDEKIQTMAASSISAEEYEEILQTLFRMHLITAEYAEYYKKYRMEKNR